MPTNGDDYDELLSAFLDGELSDEELKLVQAELGRSEPLRRQLSELSEQRGDLQQFFRRPSDMGHAERADKSLASRVIAKAQREAVQAGLPEDHHVRLAEPQEIANISSKRNVDWNKFAKAGGWLVAAAAALLLAVYLPGFFKPVADSNDLAEVPNLEREAPNRPQYVSEIVFQNQIILVVDVQLAPEARQNRVLERLLRQAGLSNAEPIVGDFEIKQALASSRSIVDESRDVGASNAHVYFLRADIKAIGQVVDSIYFDEENFPQVSFDMAIDNPAARLMESIARQTGERFAIDESFVAPVMVNLGESNSASQVASPFTDVPQPSRLVSTEARGRGFDAASLAMLTANQTSVLLLVR